MYKSTLRAAFRAANFPVDCYGTAGWSITSKEIRELRELSYFDQWKACIENSWYNVKLEDHSLFIFDEANGPSYSFLHTPISVESFRSYLSRRGRPFTTRNKSEFLEEYELAVATANIRTHVTPLRYDVDTSAYMKGRHPKAHLHIGLDNNIRLALRREMTPLSFSLFVMRQTYPDCWVSLLDRFDRPHLRRIVRDGLQLVGNEFWDELDQIELCLA
ncbi:MAG: DUF2290 domain-containing protein [Moraxellaceae bacterium]|nr:DUF2290 domain-containing protein [Moraxellaceae bacterium]